MHNKPLGCLTPTGLSAAGITIIIIVSACFLKGGTLFSPGALNARSGEVKLGGVSSHAEIRGRCSTCHPGLFSYQNMSNRCQDCHANLVDELGNFHLLLVPEDQFRSACQNCHTEHHGPQASLTKVFLVDFPHSALGFSLEAHRSHANGVPFICSDCHESGFADMRPATCAECHIDLDDTFSTSHLPVSAQDCLACHDGVDYFNSSWNHNQAPFQLTGRHASLDCQKCHEDVHSLADLRATRFDCAACHSGDDTHQGSLGDRCADCHTADGWGVVAGQ